MRSEDVAVAHVEPACEAAWNAVNEHSNRHWTADHIDLAGPSPNEKARMRKQMQSALAAAGYVVERDWCHDMSAAPRDGETLVDIWVGRHTDGSPYRKTSAFRMIDAYWNASTETWRSETQNDEILAVQVTAWRPLPTPPQGGTP